MNRMEKRPDFPHGDASMATMSDGGGGGGGGARVGVVLAVEVGVVGGKVAGGGWVGVAEKGGMVPFVNNRGRKFYRKS
jgi:hypothetical protein